MTEPSMFTGLDLDFGLRLKLIKAIASVLPTPEQAEGNSAQEIAKLVVGNSGYQILNRELDYLAADMGVDLKADAPAEKLAEVIELFDGNRRLHRP